MIVKTATEIQQFITVDSNFDYKKILPYIPLAEDELKRILGPEQYTELDDYYNGPNSGITELDELLPYAQRPVVYFALVKGFAKINVSINNNGIGVVMNDNLAPASKERTADLKQSLVDDAWDAMEYMLQFLEDNMDNYPSWEASDAFAYQYQYLISSARKFDELYKIKRSRITFLDWRPTLEDIELQQIIPQIGQEMMDELKTQIKTSMLTAPNAKILPWLQKALAYLTAAEKVDPKQIDPRVQSSGEGYLMMAKAYMDENPTDFPTYTASSAYDADLTSYQPYENDEDINIVVFGPSN